MAPTRLLSRRSRTLTFLLLGVAVPPAVTLVWLGVQLLRQEQSLQAQRLLERHQAALGSAVRSLESSLAVAARALREGPVPAGVTRLTFSATGVRAEPEADLLWWPTRPGALLRVARVLRRIGDQDGALAAYDTLAHIDTTEIEGAPADLQARRAAAGLAPGPPGVGTDGGRSGAVAGTRRGAAA